MAGLVLLGLGAGCAEFDFAEQDVALRYSAEGDRVEVKIDTRGIFATSKGFGASDVEVTAKAKERVQQMAAGARFFYLVTFPFIHDLDREWSEDSEDWVPKEQRERLQALMQASVSVTSAKVFLDDFGEVALTQEVAIKDVAACVAGLNELVSLGVRYELDENEDDPVDLTGLYGTQASRANLRAFLDAGGKWLSLDQDALLVRVPMTPFELALTMKGLLAETHSGGDPSASPGDWSANRGHAAATALFGSLEELNVEDGVVTFRFPVGDDGQIHWDFRMPRHPDAKKLVAAFDEDELK